MFRIGNQKILYACKRPGSCHGIDTDNDRKYHEDRHHDPGDPFDSAAHSCEDDSKRTQCEYQEPQFRLHAVGN